MDASSTLPAAGPDQQVIGHRAPHDEGQQTPETESLLMEELLVEEVSIDGMCGVY